jgi:hypothetical protein
MAILKPGQLASGSYTISGSFSGSFQGSGAGLNNIPSSAIVGLSSSLDIGTTPIVSGTIGRVLFQGTGNVLQQSANLFWDNTNNRLGIGTSSPLSPLHIVGSSLGTGLIVNTGYAHLGTQTNPINTTLWNAALHISHTTDAALLFRTGPTFNLSTGIGQTTTGNLYIGWRNAGNPPINVFYSTGNVGINTTTDAGFRLDVNGTARVSDNVLLTNGIIATSTATTRLQSSLNFFSHQRLASSGAFGFDIRNSVGTQCAFWTYDAGSGNINFGGSTSAGGLLFTTNGLTRATVTFDGNTLINTTTDTGHKLTVSGSGVSGSVNLDNTLYVSGSRVGIGTGTPTETLDVSGSARVTGMLFGTGNYSSFGNVSNGYGGVGSNYYYSGLTGPFRTGADSASMISFDNGGFTFRTIGNGSANSSFSWDTRATLTRGGNLMINTTTDAGFRLDVNGTARVQGNLDLLFTSVTNNPYLNIFSETQTNSRPIVFNTAGTTGGAASGYEFRAGFGGSNGSTAFRIWGGSTTSTRVGIGNLTEGNLQNSSAQLFIRNQITGGRNASIRLTPNALTSTEFNGIQFDLEPLSSAGGAFIGSQWNPLTNGYGTDLVILTTNDGMNNYLETARFVGKNQSLSLGAGRNPSASLHISGSSGSALLEIDSPAVNNILFVTGSGRVGIGTGTPTETLDVNGTARVATSLNTPIVFSTGAPLSLYGGFNNRGRIDLFNNSTGLAIDFQGNGSSRMQLYSNGNVLIGTTTDAGFRLDVNGTARVQGTGNNSASTVALSVVNSVANTNFSVRDDGVLIVRPATAIRTNSANALYYLDLGRVVVRNGDASENSQMQIGSNLAPVASAVLDLNSTIRGFLPPRMTTTQKNAIASPAEGLMIYDTDLKRPCFYNGTSWVTL